MYPSRTQYRNSVMNEMFPSEDNGGYSFLPVTKDNEPIISAGGSATVFKVKDPKGDLFALKLFIDEIKGRFDRLRTISSYLENSNHTFFTHFSFIEKLIYVEVPGAKEEDCFFPGVVMRWIEAETLETKLKELVNSRKVREIKQIAEKFKQIAFTLLDEGIAHGDLKLSNILIDEKLNLILIDYDGMYVPALKGQRAIENGTASYQHINRTDNNFNEKIDHFSILNIYTSLLALSLSPDLYAKYNDGDNIIFTKEDFISPEKSSLFKELSKLNETKGLVFFLKQSLEERNIYINNIKDLLDGKFPNPEIIITHSPLTPLTDDVINLKWETKNTSFVKIDGVDYNILDSIDIKMTANQTFQFNYGNDLKNEKLSYKINTKPKPEIISFTAKNSAIKFGEKLELDWKIKNFEKAVLKYNTVSVDVTKSKKITIDGLIKNTQVVLELTSLVNNQKIDESINIEVYYPVTLKVSQEKKITFPNRSVKFLIDSENAQKVTLIPLNIDLTGKNEYDLKVDKDLSFVIIAENKRFNVSHKSEIEVLRSPSYKKKVIELPKIEFNVPLPQFNKFSKEYLVNNYQEKDTAFIRFFKVMDKLNIFKINFKNHFTK